MRVCLGHDLSKERTAAANASRYVRMEMKEMPQVGYIFIGFLFGVLSMLITRWLQAKEDKKKNEIEIISDLF